MRLNPLPKAIEQPTLANGLTAVDGGGGGGACANVSGLWLDPYRPDATMHIAQFGCALTITQKVDDPAGGSWQNVAATISVNKTTALFAGKGKPPVIGVYDGSTVPHKIAW